MSTVRAQITKRKRHYGEARVLEIVTPSPDRVAPLADHPGAPWQVIPYEQQLEIKSQQVDDALRRLGHLDGFELQPIVPAVEQWRYRNKLEFSFGTDGEGQLICGFHAPGSWEDIVEVEDCLLQSERGNRRGGTSWSGRARRATAYDRRSQLGALRNLVIREGRRTGEIQVRLVVSDGVEVDAGTLRGGRGRQPAGDEHRDGRRDDRRGHDRAGLPATPRSARSSAACSSSSGAGVLSDQHRDG